MSAVAEEVEWIEAPTSGILHVAGDGYPRRECREGVRLLCGWVLSAAPGARHSRGEDRRGKRCVTCARWLRRHGWQES